MKRLSIKSYLAVREKQVFGPWRAIVYVALVAIVALSGPWACLDHCLIVDSIAHTHHDPALHLGSELGGPHVHCPTALHGTHHPADDPPSALTFAILLQLVLMPFLAVAAAQRARRLAAAVSVSHPLPRNPPRPSMCMF